MYKWVKFRTKHASGPGDWSFRECPMETCDNPRTEDEQLEEFTDGLEWSFNSRSEYFRGIESMFEDPDAQTMQRFVDQQREKVDLQKRTLARWETFLESMKT